MRRINRLALGVLIFLAAAAVALAGVDQEEHVRASYHGTAEMPDPIAFGIFLGAFDLSDSELAPMVAEALGLPLTEDTYKKVMERVELFRAAATAISEEKAANKFELLCSESIQTRSQQETYAALNAVDDLKELIVQKHFVLTINKLTLEERAAFLKHLQERKLNMSYAKVDSRAMREEVPDIKSAVKLRCNSIAAIRSVR